MSCYVNLPARWMHEQPAWVEWFTGGRISPEFGFDPESLALPDSWHKDIARRFQDAGLRCAVHLPFFKVDPADPDPVIAAAGMDALRRGAELARVYRAAHMIAHPYFRPPREKRATDALDGAWMERSLAAWPEIASIGGAPLFLENTYEKTPEAIAALVGQLQGKKKTDDVIGVCFDLGHWRTFAGFSREEEFDPWLDAFEPFAMHLHLHDNQGQGDHHAALGKGSIPLEAFFERLIARGKSVTATLEPHDAPSFAGSIEWLQWHKDVAEFLGWQEPRMEALPLAEIQKNIAF